MTIYKQIAKKLPTLGVKLRQAAMFDEPEEYVKKIFFTALFLSAGMSFVVFTFFPNILAILAIPIFFPLLFLYFLKYVDLKIERIKRKIDEEIIFAGRFLIIELESGVPIYKTFEDLEKNYDVVGAYFGDILDRLYLGTSIEEAINETMINTPSQNLRRILWQVLNSIKTGTNIGNSLNSVIDQIVKEQQIEVMEYGKKLGPMAMFYMMVSIIIPSLGITMLVVLATFIGVKMASEYYILLALMIGFVQFMFLSMIRTARPPIST